MWNQSKNNFNFSTALIFCLPVRSNDFFKVISNLIWKKKIGKGDFSMWMLSISTGKTEKKIQH